MAQRHPLLDAADLIPDVWPTFTDAQVSFLEKKFPNRCLVPQETLEAHIRYAGKVDLIAQLRATVIGNTAAILALSEDEEDALDAEVERQVLHSYQQQE